MMLVYVAVGGAFGALTRLMAVTLIRMVWGKRFPVGTLIVNVSGSFLMGIFLGIQLSSQMFLLLGTGMLGGFTTFSTAHYEAAAMLKERRMGKLFLYTILTYGLSMGCGIMGMVLAAKCSGL
ncbi:MAG: fluoride efflux transporter FluC [Anaerovoracaceae bacterium]|jgi:CrcB protein